MERAGSAKIVLGQATLLPGMRNPKETFRHVRNYLAGQVVGATRDDALLDEVLKCLFCKLYVEAFASSPIAPGAEPFEKSRRVRAVFSQVRSDFPDIYGSDVEIMLDPRAICLVLEECDFSLLDARSDPIGDAFEVFVGSESRGRAGQFFTPRSVTDFLVKAVDPKPGEMIIDPACGAGGFLTAVARHYLTLGTPVEELGRLASRTLFGIDKDDYLVKLARLHVSLVTKGHPNTVCGDSIALRGAAGPLKEHFPKDGFDVLLTNPPFGARIVAALPEVLRTFDLARKWKHDPVSDKWVPTSILQRQVPPQVLFVERCLSLLRDGGRLGIVLPESILSNKSYRYVMEYLTNHSDVQAVVGMPESLFKTSGKGGTHTKTCLVVAERRTIRKPPRVFMAEAKWCGQDSRAHSIPHNDLPAIADNFARYQAGREFQGSNLGFILEDSGLRSKVMCPRYYDPHIRIELDRLAETHTLLGFRELVSQNVLSVATGDELGKLAYGTGDIPFIRTSDISNWELKADHKHGVDRKLYESLKRKQDVRVGDILMVKDGTYLIGICAIITEPDVEIVYQSHLFKIRVHPNEIGLDPYLLLAVLSSPLVQRQVKAKQFTQDIIDSLGERLYELVLPIPGLPQARVRISDMVKRAVGLRVQARELAKQARSSVHCRGPLDGP